MAVRNIARGGGKAYKGGVTGLKELEAKLKALRADNPQLTADLRKMLGDAAGGLRDQMKSSAQAAGWASHSIKTRSGKVLATGQEAIDSIFASSKGASGENPRARISALAGVSKRRSMVEWTAGKHPVSPNAKVAPGGKVAEAYATMLEFGTSRMPARPAIRPAVQSGKQGIINVLTDGFQALLAKYSA
jgi:HK97 gp10 family phage protein